ncbi:MAG: hypothetical protein R3A52_22135 [Polyangiales bacterium]
MSVTIHTTAEVDIDDRARGVTAQLDGLMTSWPPLVRLDAVRRRDASKRTALILAKPMGVLLDVLVTAPEPEGSAQHREWKRLRGAFDAIGGQDGGDDPERFEAESLHARVRRIRAQQALADRLELIARRLRDDSLARAEGLSKPFEQALQLARTLFHGDFASPLAPVMDALRAMTASARKPAPAEEAEEGDATEETDATTEKEADAKGA